MRAILYNENKILYIFMLMPYIMHVKNIKYRHWGITQKKEYNIQNMAKVWNQEI